MKNRNLLSIKKLAVLGICVSFVAGGCGKMTESSIPKLEEPVALNGIRYDRLPAGADGYRSS